MFTLALILTTARQTGILTPWEPDSGRSVICQRPHTGMWLRDVGTQTCPGSPCSYALIFRISSCFSPFSRWTIKGRAKVTSLPLGLSFSTAKDHTCWFFVSLELTAAQTVKAEASGVDHLLLLSWSSGTGFGLFSFCTWDLLSPIYNLTFISIKHHLLDSLITLAKPFEPLFHHQ